MSTSSYASTTNMHGPQSVYTPQSRIAPARSAPALPPTPTSPTFTYPSPLLNTLGASPLLPSAPLFMKSQSTAKKPSSPTSCDMRRSPGMWNLNSFTRACFQEEEERCRGEFFSSPSSSGKWVTRDLQNGWEGCSSPELPSSPDSPFNSDDEDETCAESLFSIDTQSDFSVSTTSSPSLHRVPVSGKIAPSPSSTPSRRVRRRTLSYNSIESDADKAMLEVHRLVLNSPGGEYEWQKENWQAGLGLSDAGVAGGEK